LKDLATQQWWSAIAPTQSQYYSGRQSFDLRSVYYGQHDGGNLPISLPVNIWTMQCLLAESPQASMPFVAELSRHGDQVTLRVTNLSTVPISEGFVAVGRDSAMKFESVPASASREFTGRLSSERLWEVADHGMNPGASLTPGGLSLGRDAAFVAQGTLQRTGAMISYIRNGAAVVCVRYDDAPSTIVLQDPSAHYEHTKLARLVILPEMIKDLRND